MKESIPFIRWFDDKKLKKHNHPKNIIPEVLFVIVIIASYLFWDYSINSVRDYIFFALWGAVVTVLFTLAIDNEKTMLLKNSIVAKLFVVVCVYQLAVSVQTDSAANLVQALLGSLVIGGFLYIMFQISAGKWLGGGDVKLGFVAGLLLGWQLGLLVLATWILLVAVAFGMISLFRAASPPRTPSGVIWVAIIIFVFLFGENLLRVAGIS